MGNMVYAGDKFVALTTDARCAEVICAAHNSEVQRGAWGAVFNDAKQVWQIIAPDGRVIIDEIGEFRFPDNKTRREHAKRLAEQIRDNHNA